ncbi:MULTISPECIES: STM4011 family radical SAM protein [Deinococcus]|uniref:STM4011 family radical SAM protein n=1 Tax=Deinococcus rufus TaxID=2136097 RepID=A0ABV7Z659_9DEIO|nr:STM4011 family radical SAM protein [Deinococcus sp. AB2017081]WQE95960.1 STM4011 family radical SAM protein [Deinococcus sp. AB2017081]
MALGAPFHLTVLYRGPLSSCNYGCPYCPFAKHRETPEEHEADRAALERFVAWVESQPFDVSVLFTPWGEALIWPRYQHAITRLSRLPHVRQVAIQTNLSGPLGWLRDADLGKVGLWATYHPGEVSRERFLKRCAELDAMGVRYSVGVVGVPDQLPEIQAVRDALNPATYLWVNAFTGGRPYTRAERAALTHIDPLFEVNTRRYRSRGYACQAGETVISVDGDGAARRCHFISTPLGNIYAQDVRELLAPRPCTRVTCHCHIGYVHMPDLDAGAVYGDGLLARIPEGPEWVAPGAYLERARQLWRGGRLTGL